MFLVKIKFVRFPVKNEYALRMESGGCKMRMHWLCNFGEKDQNCRHTELNSKYRLVRVRSHSRKKVFLWNMRNSHSSYEKVSLRRYNR
jgi:hypothetical protein